MRGEYSIKGIRLFGCLKSASYAFRRPTVDVILRDNEVFHRPRRKTLPSDSKELVGLSEAISGDAAQWEIRGHAYFDGTAHEARWIYRYGLPHAKSFGNTLVFSLFNDYMDDNGLAKIERLEARYRRAAQPRYTRHNDNRPYCGAAQVVRRPELIMLTEGQYPNRYLPRSPLEGNRGVLVGRRGKAQLIIGDSWWAKLRRGHVARLVVGDTHWITASDNERLMMAKDARQCPMGADAFVAGLGLGVVILYLARRCKCITVAEIEQDVIELIWPRLVRYCSERYPNLVLRLYHGDALKAIGQEPGRYDFVYWDILENADKSQRPLLEQCKRASWETQPQAKVAMWGEELILGSRPNDLGKEEQSETVYVPNS